MARTLHYDALDGYWHMSDDKQDSPSWQRWREQRNDQVLDAVLRYEPPANSGERALRESMQIQTRKAHIKRERRGPLIRNILLCALILIVAAALCPSIIGLAR